MMQKEVAERLISKPGSKNYSRLTVMAGMYVDVKLCFKIPPEVFYPKLKVHSAIVRFTKKRIPLISDNNYLKLNKIVRKAFSMRRKMLKNSLHEFNIPENIKNEIDFSRRPETLSLNEFSRLVEN
jgi:16S rRNA (adenine1518-N6/adenine1519-N6)-dimethyltransferase